MLSIIYGCNYTSDETERVGPHSVQELHKHEHQVHHQET